MQYYRESGSTALSTVSPTLRNELIHSVQSALDTFQFHLPLKREALAAFNRAARHCLAYEHRVEIVKSQGKDWNQDLKQDQLQQVTKHELGTVPLRRR